LKNGLGGPTIVVVGGGFSGTAIAARLLRLGRPVEVVVVNRELVSQRSNGEYLEQVLQEAVVGAAAGASLDRIIGKVTAIRPKDDAIDVVFSDGRVLRADRVAVALENHAPADPAVEQLARTLLEVN
jgi:glycine/D-amino acid oxidase-like deaminating enzyme